MIALVNLWGCNVAKDIKPTEELISAVFSDLVDRLSINTTNNRTCVIVCGISGSGKSTAIQKITEELPSMKLLPIQPDNYRKLHPKINQYIEQYGKDEAHKKTGNFSNRMALSILDKAIENQLNVVYESTFNTRENADLIISKFIENGYNVNVIALPTDVEKSIRRNQKRYDEKRFSENTLPRIVEADVIYKMAENLGKTLDFVSQEYQGKVRVFNVQDTNETIHILTKLRFNMFLNKKSSQQQAQSQKQNNGMKL